MVRVPRRLRGLNLDAQGAGDVQVEEEHLPLNVNNQDEVDGVHPNNDNLNFNLQDHDVSYLQLEEDDDDPEDHTESEDLLAELTHADRTPINIIWPNGEVRQILGEFKVKNVEDLKEGKVIVETDGYGEPNDRSGSILGSYIGMLAKSPTFAPLDIPKWDNDLFLQRKKNIITNVETKFVYPSETKHLTRDWILKKASKAWRSYKHRLKATYFNRDERTLDEISKDVPKGVNQYQWSSLIAIWCQEKHKNLCEKNSECAKQLRNPHTTGRKSHARLSKEMEAKNKGKVHPIDVWDEAHRKKDPHMKATVEMAYSELAKRKANKCGKLSPKDYDEVFRSIVGKKTKLQGYYDNSNNWSQVKVSQGVDLTGQSEEHQMLMSAINTMGKQIESMSGEMSLMRAFIKEKYPGEDWRNMVTIGENNDDNIFEQGGNKTSYEFVDDLEESYENVHSRPDIVQQLHSIGYTKAAGHAKPYVSHEHLISKQANIASSPKRSKRSHNGYTESTMVHEDGTNKVDIFQQVDNVGTNGFDNYLDNSYANAHATSNYVQQSCYISSTSAKDHLANWSTPSEHTTKQSSMEISAKRSKTGQKNMESTVPRDKEHNKGFIHEQAGNAIMNRLVNDLEDSHSSGHALPNNVQLRSVGSARTKETHLNSVLPNQQTLAKQASIGSSSKRPRTSESSMEPILSHDGKAKQEAQPKEVLKQSSSKSDQREVYMFSLNPRIKSTVVAKGNLVTTDSTHVIGGNMLGHEFYGVAVHNVTNIGGNERLPRPSENCHTLRDAIGLVIAWPRSFVKAKTKASASTC